MAAHKKIYIGTSGFHYKHWVGKFYPEGLKQKDWFAYFLQYFDTVELNSPFYHLPPASRFAAWAANAPEGFLYSVKANRYITHLKKLNEETESVLHDFLENASALKEKLGPLLFQLPPGWKFDGERLRHFLSLLPGNYRYTFEFRNPTWYNEETYALLQEHNIAFCIYELQYHLSPMVVTADFVYIRLHGPEQKYRGSYSDATLREWAESIRDWVQDGKDVYIYFDNDTDAHAVFNALKLKELLG